MSIIHTHRSEKIKEFNETVLKIEDDSEHYKNLILENIRFKKKQLLKSLIYRISDQKKDVFDLAIHLKTIGINQFFEILKTELKQVDDKQDFLKDFDLDENEVKTKELEDKIQKIKDSIESEMNLYNNYPVEISLLFKKIFKDNTIIDQEMVLEYKGKKPFLFSKKRKKELFEAINQYYDIYNEMKTLTDGYDLFNEYKNYSNLLSIIEKKEVDIYRLKDQWKSLKQEKQIFEKDIEEMRLWNSLEKVRKIVIEKFVNFSSNVDNLDFYIEKITEHYQDKESLKELYIEQLKEEFFNELIKPFNNIEDKLYDDVKYIEHIFKQMEFCKYEKITDPYFSNVGYFENRLLNYQVAKKEFYDLFMKEISVDTNIFQEYFKKFEKKSKNFLLVKILAENESFLIFEESQVEKLNNEKNFIVNKYKKE